MKYAGMASQLFIGMFVAFWIGQKADVYFDFPDPYLTAALPSLYLFAYLVRIVKQFG